MMRRIPQYYWESHKKHASNGRLAWYAETANEEFWKQYWEAQVTPDYYLRAQKAALAEYEIGRIFAKYMKRDGLHLEAGCGAGFWVAALEAKGYRVEGIEYSKDLVQLVNSTDVSIPVRYGDALALDVPDGYYDSYISLGVIEHLVEGPDDFLKEAARVLKRDGIAIISVPNFGWIRSAKASLGLYGREQPQLPFFQFGFRRSELTALLSKYGFDSVSFARIEVHRLLLEESFLYKWLYFQRGGRYWRKLFELLLNGRDGHMLVAVARRQ